MTLPVQFDAAAADQITAAFTPGVSVVIADLAATARCDRSAIWNLLKAHRVIQRGSSPGKRDQFSLAERVPHRKPAGIQELASPPPRPSRS